MRACSTALRPWQGDHSSSGFSRSLLGAGRQGKQELLYRLGESRIPSIFQINQLLVSAFAEWPKRFHKRK